MTAHTTERLMVDALKRAQQFIENGTEYGYIDMPVHPDSAINTLPAIREALAAHAAEHSRIGTHWHDCYLDRRHHACAVAEIKRLTAERALPGVGEVVPVWPTFHQDIQEISDAERNLSNIAKKRYPDPKCLDGDMFVVANINHAAGVCERVLPLIGRVKSGMYAVVRDQLYSAPANAKAVDVLARLADEAMARSALLRKAHCEEAIQALPGAIQAGDSGDA